MCQGCRGNKAREYLLILALHASGSRGVRAAVARRRVSGFGGGHAPVADWGGLVELRRVKGAPCIAGIRCNTIFLGTAAFGNSWTGAAPVSVGIMMAITSLVLIRLLTITCFETASDVRGAGFPAQGADRATAAYMPAPCVADTESRRSRPMGRYSYVLRILTGCRHTASVGTDGRVVCRDACKTPHTDFQACAAGA